MKVSYFPGCTLRTKAKDLDNYARKCAEILGVELCEIKDWQCCGGAFVSAKDEVASKLSSVRALAAARDAGQPLVTVCSACHNVIKQTNDAMQNDEEFAAKANLYMSQDKDPSEAYNGETEVYHYLELLRDVLAALVVVAAALAVADDGVLAAELLNLHRGVLAGEGALVVDVNILRAPGEAASLRVLLNEADEDCGSADGCLNLVVLVCLGCEGLDE